MYARYINVSFERAPSDEEKKAFAHERCTITNIAKFTLLDNAVMGSNFGELFAIRFPALFVDKVKVNSFDLLMIDKKDMAISKGFDALTSMVKSLAIFEDRKVFVTGNND